MFYCKKKETNMKLIRNNIEQVSLILGTNFVIFPGSRRRYFDCTYKDKELKGSIKELGADYLAYALIDSIVDNYFVILKSWRSIEILEDELLDEPH
jgi:magnesium transporter